MLQFLSCCGSCFFLDSASVPQSYVLYQTSCTLGKESSICICSAGCVEVGREKIQAGNCMRLAWRDWESCSSSRSWLMWYAFAPRSVICMSGFLNCQLKLISHEKGGKSSWGQKPLFLFPYTFPFTVMHIVKAAEGPQPCIRSDFRFNTSIQQPIGWPDTQQFR